jgi:hypothetical protein
MLLDEYTSSFSSAMDDPLSIIVIGSLDCICGHDGRQVKLL